MVLWPVMALAPPDDQTPRFPVRVVAPVLVTVEEPRTAKLAKSEPSSGTANLGEGLQRRSAPKAVLASTDEDRYFR
jgi:hypothetical protein